MKSQVVNCGECGTAYVKPRYDLDLQVGDQVIYETWVESGMEKFPITITSTEHKAEMALYFGTQHDCVYPEKVLDFVRVDTRNHEFIKLPIPDDVRARVKAYRENLGKPYVKPMNPFSNPDIENRFTYHPPTGDQPARYEALRSVAKAMATTIVSLCPDSRERSKALTDLQQAVMWANASIACNPVKPDPKPTSEVNTDPQAIMG